MARPATHSFGDLLALVPPAAGSPHHPALEIWPDLQALSNCPQDPRHHAEGDVLTHTRMVLQAVVCGRWSDLRRPNQEILYWAAVLHDVGKPAATRHGDDGRISSRGHSRVGAQIARRLLCAAGAPFAWREAVCGLI